MPDITIHQTPFSKPLTRAQRRSLKKLAARVDKVTASDAKFFERFPHRRYRLRRASMAEVEHHALVSGKPAAAGKSRVASGPQFVAVKQVEPGVRSRVQFVARNDLEIDDGASEELAREYFEEVRARALKL